MGAGAPDTKVGRQDRRQERRHDGGRHEAQRPDDVDVQDRDADDEHRREDLRGGLDGALCGALPECE
jgi:hypothetical protein